MPAVPLSTRLVVPDPLTVTLPAAAADSAPVDEGTLKVSVSASSAPVFPSSSIAFVNSSDDTVFAVIDKLLGRLVIAGVATTGTTDDTMVVVMTLPSSESLDTATVSVAGSPVAVA